MCNNFYVFFFFVDDEINDIISNMVMILNRLRVNIVEFCLREVFMNLKFVNFGDVYVFC